MPFALTLITAVIGAVIGSFLNALMWRMYHGESVVVGRSRCTSCAHVLAAHDLIPIVSFIALRGRCRYCKTPIHASYVAVEAVTATLFALFASRAFDGATSLDAPGLGALLVDWVVAAAFVAVFFYDLRYMLIPRRVTAFATVIAIVGGAALGESIASLAIGTAVGAGVFYLQYVASRGRWIGGGDMHVGGLMGAAIGWPGVLLALFIAYVTGALYGIALIVTGKKTWKSEVPFGTFLSAAAIVTMLWGVPILEWYLRMLS